MSSPRLITVFASTGNQGGAVARSLLANSKFAVRGLTRNVQSEKALALASQGASMVAVDAESGSDEDLEAAVRGSWGLFININSDDEASGVTELVLAKRLIDAAARAGVKNLVYSGMASASKVTAGKVPVLAFDEKAAAPEYASSLSVFANVISVSPGWYMENFLVPDMAALMGGFPLSAPPPSSPSASSSEMVFTAPSFGGDVPFISIGRDYGDIAHGAFLSCVPDAGGDGAYVASSSSSPHDGALVQAVSVSCGYPAVTDSFVRATGRAARYEVMPLESFPTLGLKALVSVKGMFEFCHASGGLYYGVPNNVRVAAELKRAAVAARGGDADGDEGKLLELEKFWAGAFGAKKE